MVCKSNILLHLQLVLFQYSSITNAVTGSKVCVTI